MRIWEIIKSEITPKIELFQSFLNNFGRNILDVYFHPYFIIYNIRNIYIFIKTTNFHFAIKILIYIYLGTVYNSCIHMQY